MLSQVTLHNILPEDQDQRLDRWLKRHFPALNQIKIEKLCRKGEIRINSGRVKPSKRLISGEVVRIPPLHPADAKNEKKTKVVAESDAVMMKNAIIFEDSHFIAINKPAGLAVQGGTGQKDRHVDSLIEAFRAEKSEKPKLVHRLDKDTSGILLLAKNRKMAELLTKSFKSKKIQKIYWALVAGSPEKDIGTIRISLKKSQLSSGFEKMVPIFSHDEINHPSAKRAITDYVVIEKVSQRATWLGLSPITGRTHQLRSHMAAIGCPIVGDTKYGGRNQTNNGEGWGAQIGGVISRKLHLHARSLSFEHPITKNLMFLEADLPAHMATSWNIFNWDLKWAPKDPFEIYE